MTAVIAATATITVALVQRNDPPTPNPVGAGALSATSTPTPVPTASSSTLPRSASSRTPATPDGVTYQCTGSVPHNGIEIDYGPEENVQEAASLPFTAHDDSLQPTTGYYDLMAQLKGGGGHVTCTLTVTDSGRVTTDSGTARGADNFLDLPIFPDGDHYWKVG